uniref:AlNc14C13G1512 protein n=1 Tax=Albugo laibachii Nc14 TaxID=890382 RepID=F0W3E3_9STRA|nr:AlNc14C13G1512 [Albugo laibachii Nc14]|eukprot:CCA15586.1 AlNc14C13G1512 [Albugo laibachii Nc14]
MTLDQDEIRPFIYVLPTLLNKPQFDPFKSNPIYNVVSYHDDAISEKMLFNSLVKYCNSMSTPSPHGQLGDRCHGCQHTQVTKWQWNISVASKT